MGEAKPADRQAATQGLYMYGGVGVGKTMLMDLLVTAAAPEFKVWIANDVLLHRFRMLSLLQ